MAVLPIGSHFSAPHKLTKRHAVATPSPISFSTRLPQNVFFSKVSGITSSRLSKYGGLVRAEDKIRGSSSPSLEEQSQPFDESELEVQLSSMASSTKFNFANYPSHSLP